MDGEDYFDTFRFILYQFIEDNELGYLWIEYSSGKICFDVAKGLYHIPISSFGEIPKIDGISEENILEHLNSLELKRAKESLSKVKTILKKIPSSKDHISQRKYYENVIGEYLIWYDRNGLKPKHPTILSSGKDIQKSKSKHIKGGRPPNPQIAERNEKISREYYKLTNEKGFKKDKALEILSDKYDLAKSSIETYLK